MSTARHPEAPSCPGMAGGAVLPRGHRLSQLAPVLLMGPASSASPSAGMPEVQQRSTCQRLLSPREPAHAQPQAPSSLPGASCRAEGEARSWQDLLGRSGAEAAVLPARHLVAPNPDASRGRLPGPPPLCSVLRCLRGKRAPMLCGWDVNSLFCSFDASGTKASLVLLEGCLEPEGNGGEEMHRPQTQPLSQRMESEWRIHPGRSHTAEKLVVPGQQRSRQNSTWFSRTRAAITNPEHWTGIGLQDRDARLDAGKQLDKRLRIRPLE